MLKNCKDYYILNEQKIVKATLATNSCNKNHQNLRKIILKNYTRKNISYQYGNLA